MTYFQDCFARFQALPDEIREVFGNLEMYKMIRPIEEKYKINLSFLVILLAIEEIDIFDVADYVRLKFKLSETEAASVQEKISEIFDDIYLKNINFQGKSLETMLQGRFSFSHFFKLFSERLVDSLNAENDVIIALNFSIIDFLEKNSDIQDKLVNALFSNKEKIGTEKIILEDKNTYPTIANWLKDFIKINGSDFFDDLSFIQYEKSSINFKNLNAPEKDLLRKVFKFYRNIAFYPDSMDKFSDGNWQIIPLSSVGENQKIVDVLSDKKEEVKNYKKERSSLLNNNHLAKNIEKSKSLIFPSQSLGEENKRLLELKKMLNSYQSSTLEHKAIIQEIKKLESK